MIHDCCQSKLPAATTEGESTATQSGGPLQRFAGRQVLDSPLWGSLWVQSARPERDNGRDSEFERPDCGGPRKKERWE